MSAESDNMRDSLVDQLSSFENRLESKVDDVEMLAEIQDGIARLIADHGGSEAEIRRVLQERYDSGELRKETFQLVKSMLDRYVTEKATTTPGVVEPTVVMTREAPTATPEEVMSTTMVIPTDETIAPDSADGRIQVGSVLRDRFLLQQRLSGGGMGVVYKAMDRRLAEAGGEDTTVAIKILSPQLSRNGNALKALQQEAAKGRCLVHPNIVRFIDLDRDDDLYFIVMEWLVGETLADILDSPGGGDIDKRRAFEIVRQIGQGLDYAHRCGIVHADVKPGNIMIAPNGEAKLFDFGVARVRQTQLDKDPNFDPGVLGLVTPAYSSMQVLTGEKPVPADDVFSLACLLYRLLAGYRVFGPRNAAEAAEEGMKPQPVKGLSDAQWRVLKKALSYSRVTRFESMADFLDALDVQEADSITVDMPAPTRLADPEESSGSSRWLIGLVAVAALAGVAANQLGYLDGFKERFIIEESPPLEEPVVVEAPEPEPEPVAEEPSEGSAEEPVDEAIVEAPVDEEVLEVSDPVLIPELEEFVEPLVDFSQLPSPTAELPIYLHSGETTSITVRLREDRAPAIVDLVRDDTEFPLTLRLEEVSFSGNRSPWVSGQYRFSDNGFLEFPVGQNRARVTISMASDPLREADQQSTLRVREADSATSELGIINVVLEDDDQRAFEARLPANTVAFATSQVSVNEQDPAVQLDIMRFNPDNTTLVVGYALRDITATLGEDYFAPGGNSIEFGPGQRSTRLLIPLVQDSAYEDNEAFSVELAIADSAADIDIYHRVAVMIRDDDQ